MGETEKRPREQDRELALSTAHTEWLRTFLGPGGGAGRCLRTGCERQGELVPTFLLATHPDMPRPQRVRAFLPLPTCVECARTMTLDDVLSDEGWQKICENLKQQGLRLPRRELTLLEWAGRPGEELEPQRN